MSYKKSQKLQHNGDSNPPKNMIDQSARKTNKTTQKVDLQYDERQKAGKYCQNLKRKSTKKKRSALQKKSHEDISY